MAESSALWGEQRDEQRAVQGGPAKVVREKKEKRKKLQLPKERFLLVRQAGALLLALRSIFSSKSYRL